MQACIDQAEVKADTILTLQKRDDGLNDVRGAIETAKKERAGALDQLKSNFERDTKAITSSAAARWTKVRSHTQRAAPTRGVLAVLPPTRQCFLRSR